MFLLAIASFCVFLAYLYYLIHAKVVFLLAFRVKPFNENTLAYLDQTSADQAPFSSTNPMFIRLDTTTQQSIVSPFSNSTCWAYRIQVQRFYKAPLQIKQSASRVTQEYQEIIFEHATPECFSTKAMGVPLPIELNKLEWDGSFLKQPVKDIPYKDSKLCFGSVIIDLTAYTQSGNTTRLVYLEQQIPLDVPLTLIARIHYNPATQQHSIIYDSPSRKQLPTLLSLDPPNAIKRRNAWKWGVNFTCMLLFFILGIFWLGRYFQVI